ncbi:hypothetical protein BDW62DRAFT_216697 [Aspergillus aurantiobrunneus]
MANQANVFSGLPPFPDDVSTAPLFRLSLKDLLTEDEEEIQRLSKGCEEIGFFYLDIRNAGAVAQILEDADKLFEIEAELFELPLEEKRKYDFSSQKSYFGYKAQGAAAIDQQGNLDRNEFYTVSKDDILDISEPLPAPDVLKNKHSTLESFIQCSHSIVMLILDLLDADLGLPESTLTNIHRLHGAPPQPANDRRTALGEHTDFGSVTILFNRLGGLQVFPPGPDAEWQCVRPLRGHAIVNLGDAMVKFTNGLLRSNIHHVVSPPGRQVDSTRYSLVYFSRPEDDIPLRRLRGSSRIPELEEGVEEEKINSKYWIIRRALSRRVYVTDIGYDKSAGTEMLSRRLKVYPRSWVQTRPSSPGWSVGSAVTTPGSSGICCNSQSRLLPEVSSPTRARQRERNGSSQSRDDAFSDIAKRRRIFLASIQDTIRPLLGDHIVFDHPSETETTDQARIIPYVLLNSQPAGIQANLKPYQLEGLSWLLYLRSNGIGGILADDMGLGKTLQTLALFQYVKNHEASGDHKFLVLWSIFHWLYPELFVSKTAELFQGAFSLEGGKFDSKFLASVTRFLKHVMLRRTKSSPQIGINIPLKKEIVLSVPLTEFQLGWYHKILTGVDKSVLLGERVQQSQSYSSAESFVDLTVNEWKSQKGTLVKRSRITTNTLMELRKCSIHPYLLVDALPEPYHIGRHIVENSGKFIVLHKMVHQFVVVERKKVIIFSGFDQALNLCEDLLVMEKAHYPFRHVRLDGSTSAGWRNLSVHLFQNDPRYMVFLLSTRAGGEGLNLVSSSTVIFLDDDWNPQAMRQAESRVHRIGQAQPVEIFRIHAKGTVEDQMRQRLSKKAYLSDRVIEDLGNDIYRPIKLGETEEESSLMPNRDIVPHTFDAKNLASSDLHSIMSSCALNEVGVQEMSLLEKKAWFEREERVKTEIFNGEKVDTKSKSFSIYEETVLGVSKASRRIGKSRVVMVGEWEVLKDSIKLSSPTTPTFPKQITEAKPRKMNGTVSQSIICPHHYCCQCGKTTSEAGRLLLSCLKCPRAYCDGCLDWTQTRFIGADDEGANRGYFPQNAFFIECAGCGVSVGKRSLESVQFDSGKRARRR